MKHIVKLTSLLIIIVIMLETHSLVAFADSLKNIDGISYRYSDDGERIGIYSGWVNTSNGRVYYKNGVRVKKITIIDGICYNFNQQGICVGKYTGWAKVPLGKVYFKEGIKVKKNTVINNVRYKFDKEGLCLGKYTGFVNSSKGKQYYKNGILIRNKKITTKTGQVYYANMNGYLNQKVGSSVNPGDSYAIKKDLIYNGNRFYIFISTEAFIFGDDGKCYALGDIISEVSKPGYKIKSSLKENKKLSKLTKSVSPSGQLKYKDGNIYNDFETNVPEFDQAYVYENGNELNDYGLTIISFKPFCFIDEKEVFLYTVATKY